MKDCSNNLDYRGARKIWYFFIPFFVVTSNVFAIRFDGYHDQTFIAKYLRDIAEKNHEIAELHLMGHSEEGREITLISLSKNFQPKKSAIYLNGTHHGNEKISTEVTLGMIDYLVRHQNHLVIDRLLRKYIIIIQPLVNPDGHARHSRFDSLGRDPNRDYAYPGKSESLAFQLKETRLVRDLLRRFSIVASAAYHSGMEAILWPWCSSRLPTPDHRLFLNLGELITDAMNIDLHTQSYHDYQTEGEFIDYAYMQHGIYALTFEVASDLSPDQKLVPFLVQRAIRGTLSFMIFIDRLKKNQRLSH